jgi:hypothetical protein
VIHGHSRKDCSESGWSANPQVESGQRGRLRKLTVRIGEVGRRGRACGWKCGWPSPEPAVGVFTPAGTWQGRLRRHCVIGYADPGQNPPAVRFGSSRVQGRGVSRTTHGPVAGRGSGHADQGQGAKVPAVTRGPDTCSPDRG